MGRRGLHDASMIVLNDLLCCRARHKRANVCSYSKMCIRVCRAGCIVCHTLLIHCPGSARVHNTLSKTSATHTLRGIPWHVQHLQLVHTYSFSKGASEMHFSLVT